MKITYFGQIDTANHARTYFIRIDPEDLSVTLCEMIEIIGNLSWINQFDPDYVRESFNRRAKPTADKIIDNLKKCKTDPVTKESGESIVSELAREVLVSELGYKDIPLGELFKVKLSTNSGFDMYSGTDDQLIVFGEAKYINQQNAYGRSMEQVDRFITEKKDIADLNDIDKFYKKVYLDNAIAGDKAYAVAFSSKSTSSDALIKGILNNSHYKELSKQKEILYIAVDI